MKLEVLLSDSHIAREKRRIFHDVIVHFSSLPGIGDEARRYHYIKTMQNGRNGSESRESLFYKALKLTVIYYIYSYCIHKVYFFLWNLYLKQGIGSVFVMVNFICKGYLEL